MGVILEVRAGPLTGTQIPVPEGEPLTVGRTSRAGFVVTGDTEISGVHFAVEWDGKVCRVVDRRSTNGTLLNGNRVSESTLREGDVITAGHTKFLVRFVAGAPGVPAIPSVAAPSISAPSVPWAPGALAMPSVAGVAAVGGAAAIAGAAIPAAAGGSQKLLLGLPFVPIPLGIHVPQIPSIPAMPGMPGVPAYAIPPLPALPGLPQIPGVAMPGLPGMPSIPGVPAIPSVALPQVPAIPNLPPIPRLPTPVIHTFSAAQLAAMAAEAARRALKALWQPSLAVGGWKFMMIPKGWVVPEERIGIHCAHPGVFPAQILAGEEPLGAGSTLVALRDAHVLMMREHMREPRITENKPPQIPGAEKVLAMDVVYKLDSGAGVLLRRLYAQNGQMAGTLTLLVLMDDFARLVADLQVIQSNLRYEPTQPAPAAAIPGTVRASV